MATIEEMFAQYLEREAAKDAAEAKKAEDAAKAEAQANFVSKADLESALSAFGEQIASKIGEEVGKAMPVQRPEGAGRVGEQSGSDEIENPFEYLAKKAAEDRTPEDKALAWELTKRAITFGNL
jgi:hypothetical protein